LNKQKDTSEVTIFQQFSMAIVIIFAFVFLLILSPILFIILIIGFFKKDTFLIDLHSEFLEPNEGDIFYLLKQEKQ